MRTVPPPRAGAVAVVTGAAQGIGAALAAGLAAAGHDLLLVDVDSAGLHRHADELQRRHGVAVRTLIRDLSRAEAIAGVAAELATLDISVLCANAGQGSIGDHVRTDAGWLHDQVMLNVLAVHDLVRAVLPGMLGSGAGRVLVTGSVAGIRPLPRFLTYAATKAFVDSLGAALAEELRGTGVSCTVLAPGPVRTNFPASAGFADAADTIPGPLWVSAEHAAACGLRGAARGRRVVHPGVQGIVFAAGLRLVPVALALPLSALVMRFFVRRAGLAEGPIRRPG
jgi:short-subunit dehydrogenase